MSETPIGYWSASGADLSPEIADRIRDELPQAVAEGKQLVVVEGVTLHWTPAAADSLDAAWAEAEAALPTAGWMADGRWVLPSGSWIIGIEYRPPSGDGYFEPHYEAAYFARAQVRAGQDRWFTGDDADTPAAALRALAERLREHRRERG